jgi:hypothetical protein
MEKLLRGSVSKYLRIQLIEIDLTVVEVSSYNLNEICKNHNFPT